MDERVRRPTAGDRDAEAPEPGTPPTPDPEVSGSARGALLRRAAHLAEVANHDDRCAVRGETTHLFTDLAIELDRLHRRCVTRGGDLLRLRLAEHDLVALLDALAAEAAREGSCRCREAVDAVRRGLERLEALVGEECAPTVAPFPAP